MYRANYIECIKGACPGLSVSFNDFRLDSLTVILTASLRKLFLYCFPSYLKMMLVNQEIAVV